MAEELWDKVLDANLKGTFTACRAVVPAMKDIGTGSIIIVSSTAGQRGESGLFELRSIQGRTDQLREVSRHRTGSEHSR
jgi:Short-chain alcohol dehydrogenase of unknown specificity